MLDPQNPSPQSILGENPKGFSDPAKLAAITLKARILAGENVPLAELIDFISDASTDLTKTVKAKTKKEIITDVDFF